MKIGDENNHDLLKMFYLNMVMNDGAIYRWLAKNIREYRQITLRKQRLLSMLFWNWNLSRWIRQKLSNRFLRSCLLCSRALCGRTIDITSEEQHWVHATNNSFSYFCEWKFVNFQWFINHTIKINLIFSAVLTFKLSNNVSHCL